MYEIMKHLTVPLALLTLVSCIRESGTGGPEPGPGDRAFLAGQKHRAR